jgi:serine/threonine protein kinase
MMKPEKLFIQLLESKIQDDKIKADIDSIMYEIRMKKELNMVDKENIFDKSSNSIIPKINIESIRENLDNYNEVVQNEHSRFSLNSRIAIDEYFHSQIYLKEIDIKISNNTDQIISEFFTFFKQIKHENLVNYYEYQISDNLLKIKMDFCNYDTLKNIIKKNTEKLSIKDKVKICLDCAKGINYLHYNGILHENIKTNNILIYKNFTINQDIQYLAKLSDYGIGYHLEKNAIIKKKINFKNFKWKSPEIIKNELIDFKSDIYSFGILMWEIFSEKKAFSEFSLYPFQLSYKIAKEKIRPDLNLLELHTPSSIKNLIIRCWDDDKNIRPNAEEIVLELKSFI